MKQKIISLLLIIAICIPNLSLAADEVNLELIDKEGESSNLKDVAEIISSTEKIFEPKYNAEGCEITSDNIEIFDKEGNIMECEGNTSDIIFDYNPSKYYYSYANNPSTAEGIYATKLLDEGDKVYTDVATILYKNAIKYNGNSYNVRISIEKIQKKGGANKLEFRFSRLGLRTKTDGSNAYLPSAYGGSLPSIAIGREIDPTNKTAVSSLSNDYKIETKLVYSIEDSEKNPVNISGLFKIEDIDVKQGTWIKNFTLSKNNTYIINENTNLKYKSINNGSYIYSNENVETRDDNVYLKIDNQSSIEATYTWDGIHAFSAMTFDNSNVIDHFVVTHDPKGGTPIPDIQYVELNENATEVTEPTKPGYKFVKWVKQGETEPFDYENTPITENITIEAVWEKETYTITYMDGDNPIEHNNPENPSTYTVEDPDITFKDPTKEGYEFMGWFEEKELKNKKDEIPQGSTGNVTVYAKWKEKTPSEAEKGSYIVKHYKETEDGKYVLEKTEEAKTADVGEKVTATPLTLKGYTYDSKNEKNKSEGTIASKDEQLVLELYYNKNNYKVTFDPQGGEPDPDDQTVEYLEKATKPKDPVKDGYEFQYWYYEDENGKKYKFDFDTPVKNDINLIAKWEKVQATIEDDNGDYEGEEQNTKQPDPNTSPKIINKTGLPSTMGIFAVLALAIVLGIRYFKYRDI